MNLFNKNKNDTGYNFSEHLHRYAVWTVVSAVKRNFTTGGNIAKSIDKIQLRVKVNRLRPTSVKKFDNWHDKICLELLEEMESQQIRGASYGRSAKMINIYLKTVLFNKDSGKSEFANLVHPPIDRILILSFLKRFPDCNFENKNWTTFCREDYLDVIEKLRSMYGDCLWRAEKNWNPYNSNNGIL